MKAAHDAMLPQPRLRHLMSLLDAARWMVRENKVETMCDDG
jgi:hypothetical protein